MSKEKLNELENLGFDIKSITPETIFHVHLMNIVSGMAMIAVGIFLLYRTRKQKSSGKKTVGFILIRLGIAVSVVHILQMIF